MLVWWFFFVAYLMVLFHIFGDLFHDDELGGVAKALWVLVLIFFPIVAALVYLVARGKGMAERTMKKNAEMVAAQEQYIRSVATHRRAPARVRRARAALPGQGAARLRRHHAGGVREDQGRRFATFLAEVRRR